MRVEGIDGRDVDEPGARVAAHGDGHEPPAHLVGQLVDDGRQGDDGRKEGDHAACQFLLQHLLGDVPELQDGPDERDSGNQLAIEGGFDFRRVDGTRRDEAAPELDGHRATLSSAPLAPRDPKFC